MIRLSSDWVPPGSPELEAVLIATSSDYGMVRAFVMPAKALHSSMLPLNED